MFTNEEIILENEIKRKDTVKVKEYIQHQDPIKVFSLGLGVLDKVNIMTIKVEEV